ncbi:hypothetical protein ACJX0J_013435 [Zea mays]
MDLMHIYALNVRKMVFLCDPSELFTYPCLSVALQLFIYITHPSDILEIGVIAFIFIYRYMHYHFKLLDFFSWLLAEVISHVSFKNKKEIWIVIGDYRAKQPP